jgi:hypothetical protein
VRLFVNKAPCQFILRMAHGSHKVHRSSAPFGDPNNTLHIESGVQVLEGRGSSSFGEPWEVQILERVVGVQVLPGASHQKEAHAGCRARGPTARLST